MLAFQQALTSEREHLETSCDRLEEERESIMSEHEKVAVAHLKAMKTQETTFRSEMIKQQHLFADNMNQMKKKMFLLQKDKNKILDKSEKYKDKALKEHDVVRVLKQNIQHLNVGIENERTKITNENERLKARLKEVEKSRDMLMNGGGGGGGGWDNNGSLVDDKDLIINEDSPADTERREEVASYMNKLRGLMK